MQPGALRQPFTRPRARVSRRTMLRNLFGGASAAALLLSLTTITPAPISAKPAGVSAYREADRNDQRPTSGLSRPRAAR